LGKLKSGARDGVVLHGAAAKMLRAWRQALAVEIGAAARAATELTVAFVNERRQFGKPIGAYQAVQHRLSECTTAVHAIEALVRRAAALGTDEAILAALTFAKENCTRIIYDTHQFQGAIGLTYEYPLHFYTYRLRLLHGELGGPQESAEALALERWRDEAPDWGA
jgi:alkylation response protein AidB-like acyl-CoA dehydrogenase